jgi:hypothetical protein
VSDGYSQILGLDQSLNPICLVRCEREREREIERQMRKREREKRDNENLPGQLPK